jgi:hypothetical protein
LLGLGKVVVRVAVELELSKRSDGYILHWKDLCRVEQVKAVFELVLFVDNLDTKLDNPLEI